MAISWDLQKWLKENRGITDPKEIRDLIALRTRYKISLQSVKGLLLKEIPQILRVETIQALCDTFNCRLSDFYDITPSADIDSDLPLNVGACCITSDEDLYSFIQRVQLAAITQVTVLARTHTRAAIRLGYTRTSLSTLHRRLKKSKKTTSLNPDPQDQQSSRLHMKPIPLPVSLFIIKRNENLQTFLARVQLAAITETMANQATQADAALRLGYTRSALLTLLRKLRHSRQDHQTQPKPTAHSRESRHHHSTGTNALRVSPRRSPDPQI